MSLAFDFHPEAEAEFDADVFWYEDREPGSGGRFRNQVGLAVDAAVDDPEAWAVWPGWYGEPVVRSKGVNGFPYRVVYLVRGDRLTIVAVAHAKRRPGYWRDRAVL
ncbi:MAG: type II toxin-antitoxin system RelE/ParE family toxin [Nocardioides sp.]|nr:type II toxin-antitoxin system RelE/ParE family toxin [Nocardioides sp.]